MKTWTPRFCSSFFSSDSAVCVSSAVVMMKMMVCKVYNGQTLFNMLSLLNYTVCLSETWSKGAAVNHNIIPGNFSQGRCEEEEFSKLSTVQGRSVV